MLDQRWFVIERSAAIQSKPVGFHILDQPIVLVRSQHGNIIALEDRCPHQGVPLSLGRLSPNGLSCRFHGWSFDARGHCVSMPGMASDLIDEIRIQSYQAREVEGLIWISRSTSEQLPGCIADAGSAKAVQFLWDRKWRESASDLQTRLSDKYFSEGSVVQIEVQGAFGCSVQATLCITPETPLTCRIFAFARVAADRMPGWLARMAAKSVLDRLGDPSELLGGHVSLARGH